MRIGFGIGIKFGSMIKNVIKYYISNYIDQDSNDYVDHNGEIYTSRSRNEGV